MTDMSVGPEATGYTFYSWTAEELFWWWYRATLHHIHHAYICKCRSICRKSTTASRLLCTSASDKKNFSSSAHVMVQMRPVSCPENHKLRFVSPPSVSSIMSPPYTDSRYHLTQSLPCRMWPVLKQTLVLLQVHLQWVGKWWKVWAFPVNVDSGPPGFLMLL